jgi:phospholipase/carboxylesterase
VVALSDFLGARLGRRAFLAAAAGAVVAACAGRRERREAMTRKGAPGPSESAAEGRLLARPRPVLESAPTGLRRLGLGSGRDGLVYVPAGYRPSDPAPLVLMLHGAGGRADYGLAPFRPLADEAGLLLLAPESRGQTWDILSGRYGPDVAFLDRALAQTFGRYAVDPARVAAEGFSDGASYALSLGLTNGDLFTHLIAFSPGFLLPAAQRGSPWLFISHGRRDEVLPIESCSRRIVPAVRRAGYDVRYEEFAGGHLVPPDIARAAAEWFAGASPRNGAP